MKKTLVLVVSIAFAGTSLTIPAVGAVKAGASCTKAGATSTAAGKKFTCVKSGKKLSWNKGVAITKPTPSPTPTSNEPGVPSSTPSPVPSVDQVVAKTPEFPTSFANLEERYQGIPYGVWDKIQTNLGLHKSSELKISFLFGPNTPQRYPDQWTINAVTLGSRVMGSQKQPI